MTLKEDLKAFAATIGIDRIGITSAAPLSTADMPAADGEAPAAAPGVAPAELLPGARSVICAVLSYRSPRRPAPAAGTLAGVVAAYARERDYHLVMPEKLARIAAFLQQNAPGPVACHIATDNTPLYEKGLAVRAGLGSLGCHTLLLVPGLGSWVVLGEIVTTAYLPPDQPVAPAACRHCRRCLAACPTGALSAPYRLARHRCLSYVTQMRGPLPPEFRTALGRRIWGCDSCQAACPANRTQPESSEVPARLGGDPVAAEQSGPELASLLRLTEAEYTRLFGETPLAWRGRTVLQRNAAVALGNTGAPAAATPLAAALEKHPSAVVRGACAWALGKIKTPAAAAALRRALTTERHPDVLAELTAALASHEAAAEERSARTAGTSHKLNTCR